MLSGHKNDMKIIFYPHAFIQSIYIYCTNMRIILVCCVANGTFIIMAKQNIALYDRCCTTSTFITALNDQ